MKKSKVEQSHGSIAGHSFPSTRALRALLRNERPFESNLVFDHAQL